MKIPMRPRRSRLGGPATLPLACAALLLIAAGPVAIYALVLGLGGIGTLRLARRVRSERSR
jgi:hypothetical protein